MLVSKPPAQCLSHKSEKFYGGKQLDTENEKDSNKSV